MLITFVIFATDSVILLVLVVFKIQSNCYKWNVKFSSFKLFWFCHLENRNFLFSENVFILLFSAF